MADLIVIDPHIGLPKGHKVSLTPGSARRWIQQGWARPVETREVVATGEQDGFVTVEPKENAGTSLDALDFPSARHRNELVRAGFDTVEKIANGGRQALIDVWGVAEDDVDDLQARAREVLG